MSKAETDFIIFGMLWSFSRMNYNCLYQWFRHYVECEPQESNFYAEFGSLVHECIEFYCKGVLPPDQILVYYDNNFDDYCQSEFDPERREQYYNQGYEYLKDISEYLPLDEYEIIGVEQKVEFTLKEDREGYEPKEYPITGFIDLLLRNKETGELELRDHKSASMRWKKNGEPYQNHAEHWQNFKRQQYLYCVPFVESGEKIGALSWNMFRMRFIKQIPWDYAEYKEAYYWALDQIHKLESEEEWEPTMDFFYCKNLCGYRNSCPYNAQEEDFE